MNKVSLQFPKTFLNVFLFLCFSLLITLIINVKVSAAPALSASGANSAWFNTEQSAIVYVEEAGDPVAETRYSWATNEMTDSCTVGGTITDNAEVLVAPSGGTTLYLCSRDTLGDYSTWSGEYNWEITPPSSPLAMTILSPTWKGDHFISGVFIANAPSGSSDTGGSGLSFYTLSRCDDLALTVNCTVIETGVNGTEVTVSGSHLPAEGGTMYYYWTATDNALNISDSSVPEYVRMDTTGPIGTIFNANGDPTNTATPTLNFTLSDDGVGIVDAQMELSCNAADWSPLENYVGTKNDFNIKPLVETYGCGTSDGPRIVYVRFYDSLGNMSATDNTGTFTLTEITPTPTLTPTEELTPTPTEIPTITPTDNVTPTPTEIPTLTPTDNVTPTPTEIPTLTPTDNVTPTPSEIPTLTPTDNVTPTSTAIPSNTINPSASGTPVVSNLPATSLLGDSVDKVILGTLIMGLGLFMYYSGNYLVIGNVFWENGGKSFYNRGKGFYGGFNKVFNDIQTFLNKGFISVKIFLNNIGLFFVRTKDQISLGILEFFNKLTNNSKKILTHTKKNVKKSLGSVGLSKKQKFENDLLDED